MSDKNDAAILKEAKERFAHVVNNDKSNRDNQRSDTQFVYVPGKQWPDEVRGKRDSWKEISLEFNQLKQFVNQVVNDQRQNRPGIRIHPAGADASKETAEILQGLIRGIEYESQAEAAYDVGFQNAVVGGRGWWRVCSEYEAAPSFYQRLVIKPIPDSNTVYADTAYQEADGSDREFVFVAEIITRKQFERTYPDAEPVSWDDVDSHWKDGEDKIVIADYYRRVCKKRTLVQMSDGAKGWKDEMPAPPEGVTIIAEREADSYTVEWYKLNGAQVLEKYDWPGTFIPVVCTTGDDIIVDGERMYQGLIRQARDPQTMFNFGMTQQATHLALTPKAPWVVAEGQIEGYEEIWKNANTNNYSVLPYKPTDINGTPVPPPQRIAPSMPDAGWINWCGSMTQMIRSTIGMYENSLGMKGQEQSGKAIIAREKQGDTATFHYVDNQSRAIALTGRIIVELIPKYYDTERIVHIIGLDDIRKEVTINQTTIDPSNPLQAIKNNDVTTGEYSVVVQAGPGYATKRQQTSEQLMQLVQAFPPAAQVAGDLIVKSLDVADADVIAERLKLALPPQIQNAIKNEDDKNGKPPDPRMMAAMMQMQQRVQQAEVIIKQLHDENQQLKTGEMVKVQDTQTRAQTEMAKAQSDAQQAAAAEQTKRFDSLLDAASKIVSEAMKLPMADQESAAKAATDAMEPVIGPEVAAMKEMVAGLMAMAQQAQQTAMAAAAPRSLAIQYDETGRVIGGTSTIQ